MASEGGVARSPFPSATLAGIVLVSLAAWTFLFHHTGGAHAIGLAGFAPAFAMWNVMMVAMMLPSLAPWLGLFPPGGAALFAAGYFTVWAAYCAAAAALQVGLSEALLVPRAGGGVILMTAGVFELTPLKASCLTRCRSPIGHLLSKWRSGGVFFLRVGIGHGINCLGCCWALMAVAFALGVMNLWWMAALTAAVAVEKLAPWGERASRVLGIALVVWGAFFVVFPA